jgi:TonB family protein
MSLETVVQNVLSYSLQATLLVGVGALLAAVLRLQAPRWALGYWQAVLAAALALPWLQPWRPAEPPGNGEGGAVAPVSTVVLAVEGAEWPRLVVGLLLAGVLVRFLRLGLGLRALRRYRIRSRPLPDLAETTPAEVSDARLRLVLSPDVAAPATYGLLRPVVLLPPAFTTMDSAHRRALVLHEALHARGRHWPLVVAEELVQAVLWFHPAIAWLVGRIRLCREQVVDQEVVRLTGARRAYLETLLAIAAAAARGPRPFPAPLFLKPSHLGRRVDLLLKEVTMSTARVCLTLTVGPAVLLLAGSLAVSALPLEGPPALTAGDAAGDNGALQPPKLVQRVAPVYPAQAKKDGVEGEVRLAIRIDASGEVSNVAIVGGEPSLAEAAVVAVRQWRYEPSDRGPLKAHITVRFTLDKKASGRSGKSSERDR